MKTIVQPAIPYARQEIEEDDINAVVEVLRSPFLTTGPKVREFEAAIAQRVGAKYAISFSSGTAGLHGAVLAAGIGPGDEVLVPTMSFLATANCAVYAGATPVFIDSEKNGFNLDVQQLESHAQPSTRAVIAVDFAGQPADYDALRKITKEKGWTLIADAAHSLGADYEGRPVGALADMTVFSFHPVKHITTGEGGMVVTDNPDLAKRLRQLRHHGVDVDVVARDATSTWRYDMVSLGYNYRMTDIQAALGVSQLKKLDRFLERRRSIAAVYDAFFSRLEAVEIPPRSLQSHHAWHLYLLRLNLSKLSATRDEIFRDLREQGIGVHVHYRPIHLHSYYQERGHKQGECPNAEAVFERLLTIPMFSGLSDDDVRRVTSSISNVLDRYKNS